MKRGTLIARGLRHYWNAHRWVLCGVACTAAVLTGALAVGDSVRKSLALQVHWRTGGVRAAMHAMDRRVRPALADAMQAGLGEGAVVAPVLHLPGVATPPGGGVTGLVEVLGVDARFGALAPGPTMRRGTPADGKAWINEAAAAQLGVAVGDVLVVRVEAPSPVPRDAAVATYDDVSFGLRVDVDGILSAGDFGRFDLRSNPLPTFSVVVGLEWLCAQLELEPGANTLLAGGDPDAVGDAARLDKALAEHWTLADAGLELVTLESGVAELRSGRLFIDQALVDAVGAVVPGAVGVLTYFVNALRHGEAVTPYSTVAGIGALGDPAAVEDPVLRELLALAPGPDALTLNQWCASDLGAGLGSEIELDFTVADTVAGLRSAHRVLRVGGVTELSGAAADATLMPPFPGLGDAASCRDWEPGLPVELARLRPKDERYWELHRGTPKAFVALETARAMWASRFGSLSAVRLPAARAAELARALPRSVAPAAIGLYFTDVASAGRVASAPTTDFAGLFGGMSGFTIIAAVLLTALLFVFSVEQRWRELGTLMAVGFAPAGVRRLLLGEALVIAVLGGLLGAGLGLLYTRAVLWALGSVWSGAVGGVALEFDCRPVSLAAGAGGAVLVAMVALYWSTRRAFATPVVALLRRRAAVARAGAATVARVVAPLAALAAVGLWVAAPATGTDAALWRFAAGALLLVGALAAVRLSLGGGGESARPAASRWALAWRNAARRPVRSMTCVGLLAAGVFTVTAVQAFRQRPPEVADAASGTGGFALFGRSALPVLRDLGTPEGRDAYGLGAAALRGVDIVPLRVRDGDEASCLNLGSPAEPRLLGVDPEALAARGAFSFAAVDAALAGDDGDSPWRLLGQPLADGAIAAIGDAQSTQWSLHLGLGEQLLYRDDRGATVPVRLVGTLRSSILQGSLIVDESQLARAFPKTSGHRAFLIGVDGPAERVAAVRGDLSEAFADLGLELTPTAVRLAAFQAVQNTYLRIFLVLGGLGLLLGSVGLGAVVLRNAAERRGELAALRALGFTPGLLHRLLWMEHGALLAVGLVCGAVSALVAVAGSPEARGWRDLLWVLPALAASGALWVGWAGWRAGRGELNAALRGD